MNWKVKNKNYNNKTNKIREVSNSMKRILNKFKIKRKLNNLNLNRLKKIQKYCQVKQKVWKKKNSHF